jgi:YD repeat-containing protein
MVHVDQNINAHVGRAAARGRALIISTLAVVAVSGNLQAGELVPPPGLQGYFADEANSAEFANLALHYLNELSARRRLTTVFPNEQSPFYGVQLNYVNVREGNLTFLMRDMVRGAAIPIAFGRIYDSRKQDESDFGRGWKLSVAESLQLGQNGLVYTDAGNSTYVLHTDGSRIWSEHPHLTGIGEGSLQANEALIRSGHLTKVFRRRGDSFRFVEIRDRSGHWLRFNYHADGSISRIFSSAGRYVDIVRDRSMKIVGARDDAGRSTRYTYDAMGALAESLDIGGGVTRYRYDDQGFLSDVIDSRGLESLAAQFHADGKVATVDSQHEKTAYEYGAASTTVRNALQQAAVMTYHASGLVESATDFAGGITTLELDQDLRVQRLSFNGATLALAQYRNGRLSTLNRVDAYDSSEQRFYYDSRGRLARVAEDDEVVARYGYDNFDRVVYALDSSSGYSGSYGSHGHSASGHARPEDAGAARRYRFDARGHLSGLSMNDVSLGFRVNRFGMVERVTWAENSAMDIAYVDTDRVQSLRFSNADASVGAEYEYDEGGFRVSGRYDVLKALGATDVALDYDSTGNLIRLEMPGREGTTRVMQHTIGSENQLLLVTPLGAEAFEQAIEYDQSGRAVRSTQGGQREAAFRYDELGRLTDVYLDREHVLTSRHGPMDIDPVHASDDYSAFTATGDPVASAVFGSLDEIVYTRPFGTPYGVVRFVPEMARFVILEHPVVPPDSVLLASLRRRNLASEDTLNPSPLLGFDKPSSSLFVPPEFFTSNCSGCIGGVSGFDVDRVGSGPIVTGQTINFEADGALEYCYYWYLDGYEISEIPYDFFHNVAFLGGGGSGPGTFWSPFAYAQFSGSYSTPGTKTVQDTLQCACGGIFLAQAQEVVCVDTGYTIPPGPTVPSFDLVSLIDDGQTFGQTAHGYNDSLVCQETCIDGETRYRLEGDMVLTLEIDIATQLPNVDMCSGTARTSANVLRTQTHEIVHAEAYIDRINGVRTDWLGTVYASASSCNTALQGARSILATAMSLEAVRQGQHLDHANEAKYSYYCPAPGSTVEYQCGVGGPNCASGNTY